MLEMRGIKKAYGAVQANRGIDLDVAAGQIVGLLGENGSGKSTLVKLISGVHRPDAGVIEIGGRQVAAGWRHRNGAAGDIDRRRALHRRPGGSDGA